jgi:hypothetical protein
MTIDHQPHRDLDALYHDLDDLIAACEGANRHDQAIAAISFCIDEGINTGPQIIGMLKRRKFNSRHIGLLLHDLASSDPARHFWWRDGDGVYRCHPQST